jgi:hypothetical protein
LTRLVTLRAMSLPTGCAPFFSILGLAAFALVALTQLI